MSKLFTLVVGIGLISVLAGAGCTKAPATPTTTSPETNSTATVVPVEDTGDIDAALESANAALDDYNDSAAGVTSSLEEDTAELTTATNNLEND